MAQLRFFTYIGLLTLAASSASAKLKQTPVPSQEKTSLLSKQPQPTLPRPDLEMTSALESGIKEPTIQMINNELNLMSVVSRMNIGLQEQSRLPRNNYRPQFAFLASTNPMMTLTTPKSTDVRASSSSQNMQDRNQELTIARLKQICMNVHSFIADMPNITPTEGPSASTLGKKTNDGNGQCGLNGLSDAINALADVCSKNTDCPDAMPLEGSFENARKQPSIKGKTGYYHMHSFNSLQQYQLYYHSIYQPRLPMSMFMSHMHSNRNGLDYRRTVPQTYGMFVQHMIPVTPKMGPVVSFSAPSKSVNNATSTKYKHTQQQRPTMSKPKSSMLSTVFQIINPQHRQYQKNLRIPIVRRMIPVRLVQGQMFASVGNRQNVATQQNRTHRPSGAINDPDTGDK